MGGDERLGQYLYLICSQQCSSPLLEQLSQRCTLLLSRHYSICSNCPLWYSSVPLSHIVSLSPSWQAYSTLPWLRDDGLAPVHYPLYWLGKPFRILLGSVMQFLGMQGIIGWADGIQPLSWFLSIGTRWLFLYAFQHLHTHFFIRPNLLYDSLLLKMLDIANTSDFDSRIVSVACPISFLLYHSFAWAVSVRG